MDSILAVRGLNNRLKSVPRTVPVIVQVLPLARNRQVASEASIKRTDQGETLPIRINEWYRIECTVICACVMYLQVSMRSPVAGLIWVACFGNYFALADCLANLERRAFEQMSVK